jgi:glycine cleavage system pyridoxal-binding protein P
LPIFSLEKSETERKRPSCLCAIRVKSINYRYEHSKNLRRNHEKIRRGEAVVLTAEEVSKLALTASPEEIAAKVDVVTTATFGAMCSSGAIINFGHADPPIRMEKSV